MAAAAASLAIHRSSIASFPNNLHPKTTSLRRKLPVPASSKPQTNQTADDKAAFVSQEDVKYLVQLGGASVAGAAAIKYGSIIFPEITQPNLAQALFIIFAPVTVAVMLLSKQSRV
ncbi:uncharacterized protein LOC121792035 [Salvia splendens]|uniref:uncharacterized protein LOC121792035 n=1 Tax=Salvia splendens TaxID=180675 RepID=UPI0011027C94|nr:uncharacterized protein LOC121792035 [Salvia splendens]